LGIRLNSALATAETWNLKDYGEGYTYESGEWPKEISVIAFKKNPKAAKCNDH
jgi:hypothetical protein